MSSNAEETGRLLGARVELLSDRRWWALTWSLVTLTGIGGIGKTRLALELGANATEFGWANVYFVELASVTNPRLVDEAVLESVGGESSRSPLPGAVRRVEAEHFVEAGPPDLVTGPSVPADMAPFAS